MVGRSLHRRKRAARRGAIVRRLADSGADLLLAARQFAPGLSEGNLRWRVGETAGWCRRAAALFLHAGRWSGLARRRRLGRRPATRSKKRHKTQTPLHREAPPSPSTRPITFS